MTYLYEMSKIGKPIETESPSVVVVSSTGGARAKWGRAVTARG